jgi:hypothetical protein
MPRFINATATAAVLTVLIVSPALSQVATYPPYGLYGRPNVTVGDAHRYEMDRLRAQADRNQALADSQALQTQITIQQLQAQRQPPLSAPAVTSPSSLDQARRARLETEARSQALTRSASQIDAWLDRGPQ